VDPAPRHASQCEEERPPDNASARDRNIGKDFAQAAGAVMDMGKSALAELRHKQAEATSICWARRASRCSGRAAPGPCPTIIQRIDKEGDNNARLDHGSAVIKPHAYIVAGRVKVAVGWARNGLEVPYEVLMDELPRAAR